MSRIKLLDCTLRDGGYINDWNFGENVIEKCIDNLEKSRAEIIEIGFLKDEKYKKDRTVYNDVFQISRQICPKKQGRMYAAMIECVNPIPLEMLKPCSDDTVDMIRVIVWKTKHDKDGKEVDALQEGFRYCKGVVEKGYKLSVQPARVDQYSEKEFVDMIELFNTISPYAFYIVDSWGTQTPTQIMSYVRLADKHLADGISIGYHGHDNKNLALDIAKAVCTSSIDRDIIIDSSVMGIGRGAGNLDSSMAAKYLNEEHGKNYGVPYFDYIGKAFVAPIYEYAKWGKTLPFYMTAERNCNPNYAQYYDFDLHLPMEDIEGILDEITPEDRIIYSEKKAKKYLRQYRKKQLDLVIVVPTCGRSESIDVLLFSAAKELWYFGIDIVIYDSSDDRKTESVVNNFIFDGYDNVFYKRYDGKFDGASLDEKVISAYREHLSYDYIWVLRDGLIPHIDAIYEGLKRIAKKSPDFIIADASFRNDGISGTKEYDDCTEVFSENSSRLAVLGTLIASSSAAERMVSEYPIDNTNYSLWLAVTPFRYIAESDAKVVQYIGDVFGYNPKGTLDSFWNKAGNAFDQWGRYWYNAISALPAVYDEYKPSALKINMYDFHPFYLNSLMRMRANGGLNMKLVRKYWDIIPRVCDTPMWKFKLAARMPKWLAKKMISKQHYRLYKLYSKLSRV